SSEDAAPGQSVDDMGTRQEANERRLPHLIALVLRLEQARNEGEIEEMASLSWQIVMRKLTVLVDLQGPVRYKCMIAMML
ncbi:MAG: hypothetical protein AAGM67_21290, partial [Bacteroidota bacterium]